MPNSTRMVLCTLRPFVMGCVLYYHKYFSNHLCQIWCVCFDVWCMCSYQLMNWVNAVKEFIFWRNFWKWSQNNNNLEALKRRKGQLRHILLSVTQKLPSFFSSNDGVVWWDENLFLCIHLMSLTQQHQQGTLTESQLCKSAYQTFNIFTRLDGEQWNVASIFVCISLFKNAFT